MAGADPTGAFDPDEYRAGIRLAMTMGLPEDDALKPTFHFKATVVNATADPGNRPWDFTTPKASTSTPEPVQVLCGMEFDGGQETYASVGKFEARTAVLSFFEDEWAEVGGADPIDDGGFSHVYIGGRRYKRGATLEPGPLFDTTIFRVEVIAEDI